MPGPSLGSAKAPHLGIPGEPNGQALPHTLPPKSPLFYVCESLFGKTEFCYFRMAALGEQCPPLKTTFPPFQKHYLLAKQGLQNKVANPRAAGPPGLNAVPRVIEGVAHHIRVGVMQLPEHLKQEPTFLIHKHT